MSRGVKIIKGSFVSSLNLFLQIAISFFMMPFLVHALGDSHYGLWSLVATFMGYYGLLDLGISAAVSRFVSRAIGQKNEAEKKHITSTAFYVYILLGTITMLLTLGFCYAARIIVSDAAELHLFRIILLIMGMTLSTSFPLKVFNGVLVANIRQDVTRGITFLNTGIKAALIVYVIKAGFGIVGLAIVTALTSIGAGIALISFAYNIERELSVSFTYFQKSKVRELFGYSVYIFISRVADIMKYRIDSFVIAKFVSLSAVTHYSIALRLTEYLINFVYTVVSVISPVFSQEEGKGDFDSIRAKFRFTTKISSFMACYLGFMALLYGKVFILRWMGPSYNDAYLVLQFLIVPIVIGLSQTPLFNVLYAISRHKVVTFVSIGEGITNFVLSIILVKTLGIFGVALGTAIPMTLTTVIIFPYYVCRVLSLSLQKYYLEVLQHVFICLTSLLPVWWFVKTLVKPEYPSIVLFVVVQSIICGAVILFIGFTKVERQYLLKFVRKQ